MNSLFKILTPAFVLALTLVATPALAGDVDGKWAGTVSTPGGDFPVAFEFKSDGTKLTGTTMNPEGGSVAIKDGKIDGDKIAFGVSLDFGGMTIDIAYTGVVSPTELKLIADVAGKPLEFVVKK
jgi:hypothetical protein